MSLDISYDELAQECHDCGEVYYNDAADFMFRCASCDRKLDAKLAAEARHGLRKTVHSWIQPEEELELRLIANAGAALQEALLLPPVSQKFYEAFNDDTHDSEETKS